MNTKPITVLSILLLLVGIGSFALEHSAEATTTKSVFTIRGYANLQIQNGLTIQGHGYTLTGPANHFQTNTVSTKQDVNVQLVMWDKLGSYMKKDVAIYMNLNGKSRNIKDSDTYLVYDSTMPLQIVDPHKIFSKVSVSVSNNGNFITLKYDIVFAKQMQKSDIIISAWDQTMYVENTQVFDALQVA